MNREQFQYFRDICDESVVSSILSESSTRMKNFKSIAETCLGINYNEIFKTKMTSELFSKTVETVASEVFTKRCGSPVTTPTTDNDPDLYFQARGYPLEVKVTAGETFIGGEFSKRESPTLLLAWDSETANEFFLALAFLRKDDWKSGGENFYGTSLPKKKVYELVQDGRAVILYGSLDEIKRKDGTSRSKRAFRMVKKGCD